MLLQKNVILALIRTRLKALERHADQVHPKRDIPAVSNELTALCSAVDDLPGLEIAPDASLQKVDPMEAAIDMIGLRIRQIMDINDPARFIQIQRLGKLAQMIKQEASNRVADFMQGGELEACGPRNVGGYGHHPMHISAPYGMAENPEGPVPRPLNINDLYREAIETIRPMMDQRAEEGQANISKARAVELRNLLQSRKEMLDSSLDTAGIDERILELSTTVRTEDVTPPNPAETAEDHDEPSPAIQEVDPLCSHCTVLPPIVVRDRRVHIVEQNFVDCRTTTPGRTKATV